MLTIRAASLTGFTALADSLGLDGRSLLERAGLSEEALRDPENRISAEAVARAIGTAARESGCENFGLLMSEYRTFATLGPISVLLERLPNLREVIRTYIAYQRYLTDIIHASLEESRDGYCFRIDLRPGVWPVQVGDLVLAMAHKVLAGASHGHWRPEVVHAARAVPGDLIPWRRIFGSAIEFDSEFYGLSASRRMMETPNPLADEVMAANVRRLLDHMRLPRGPEDFATRVRGTIAALLPERRATLAEAAARLNMSPRAVQRKLAAEGERFDALLDDVRRDLATSYLAGTNHRITTVADLLGYESPSSFTRWFSSAFGMSPRAWREAQQRKP